MKNFAHTVKLSSYADIASHADRLVPDHTDLCPYCGASAKEKRKHRDLGVSHNIAMICSLFLATCSSLAGAESGSEKINSKQSNMATTQHL